MSKSLKTTPKNTIGMTGKTKSTSTHPDAGKGKEEILSLIRRLPRYKEGIIDSCATLTVREVCDLFDEYAQSLTVRVGEMQTEITELKWKLLECQGSDKPFTGRVGAVTDDLLDIAFKPYKNQNLLMNKLKQLKVEGRNELTAEEMQELENWANNIQ